MRYAAKPNRIERRQIHAAKLQSNLSGTGLYVFENNTDGDLSLPKPTSSGLRVIGPRKRFQGDSYFLKLVGSPMNLLKLVEEIQPKLTTQEISDKIQKETNMATEKLILDQPDTVTTKGKVEHVVDTTTEPQKLHDSNNPSPTTPEVLLTENPLDGVAIIKG